MTRDEMNKYLANLKFTPEAKELFTILDNQYVVAYANLFDNTIDIDVLVAESKWQALVKCKFMRGVSIDGITIEDIKRYFFDSDGIIEVFKIEKQLS